MPEAIGAALEQIAAGLQQLAQLAREQPLALVTSSRPPRGSRYPQQACPGCAQLFDPTTSRQRFCSRTCRIRWHRAQHPYWQPEQRACRRCGETFLPSTGRSLYCGPECRVAAAARRRRQPSSSAAPPANTEGAGLLVVALLPVVEIVLDPERLQFRRSLRSDGTTGRLSGCGRYNPALARTLTVWRDPADGRIYLADGHHRLSLARRDGVERVAVQFLEASSAGEARRLAALANIADGSADAVEVARFLRESGSSRAELEAYGISRRSGLLRNAEPLLALAPPLFAEACAGTLALPEALALAGVVEHAGQQDLWRHAQRRGWGADQIKEAAALAAGVVVSSSSAGGCLPGLEALLMEVNTDLDQRLAVRAEIRRRLGREVRALGVAATQATAQVLEDSGAAVVDQEVAADGRAQAQVAAAAFGQLVGSTGPLAELVGVLAQRMVREGLSAGLVVGEALPAIRATIAAELGGL